jgi:hypothetical protein
MLITKCRAMPAVMQYKSAGSPLPTLAPIRMFNIWSKPYAARNPMMAVIR